MENLLKTNKVRYVLSIIIALIIAVVVNFYYAETEFYLIPVITFYVMQTSIGNSFYQEHAEIDICYSHHFCCCLVYLFHRFLLQNDT